MKCLFACCGIDVWLGVEHDQSREEYIEKREHEHGEQHVFLFGEDAHEHGNLGGIPQEFQHIDDAEHTGEAEDLKLGTNDV